MSKYAPANAEGLKPYAVEIRDWRETYTRIVYAADVAAARAKYRRNRPGFRIINVRRALAEEVKS